MDVIKNNSTGRESFLDRRDLIHVAISGYEDWTIVVQLTQRELYFISDLFSFTILGNRTIIYVPTNTRWGLLESLHSSLEA